MNILMITTNWPSEESPIDGIFVREHVRAAATLADVRVVHLQRARGESLLGLSAVDDDPPILRARYRRFGKPISAAAFLAAPLVAQRRLARNRWSPDLIHAHSFLSALPALALGRILRRPVVYSEHWSVFLPENPVNLSGPMRVAARFALEHAKVVLPVSDALATSLRTLAPRAQLRVVPNVVDDALFRPDGARSSRSTRNVLTVGLLDNDAKGVDVLLEALSLLPEDQRVHLDVVGDGVLRPALEQLASRLGITPLVRFHGLLPKPEVAGLMRQADLFALASRFENNPCVLLEAMACGLPIVATRIGGVP